MPVDLNIPLILFAGLIASASPGPATLTIAGTSMSEGRASGLAVALGIVCGSLTWSISAALGMGALLLANLWLFETIRYLGAAYLIYLAYKSARSALSSTSSRFASMRGTKFTLFSKGLLLHITNPKAVLFFGSLYALAIPSTARPLDLMIVIAAVGLQSFVVFTGYALIFSSKRIVNLYVKSRRWFEGIFAICFGAAGFKILMSRFQ